MFSKKIFVLTQLAALFALLLAACGAADTVDVAEPVTQLTVKMTEFMFNPQDLVVPVAEEVTLNLSNAGAVEHNFVILKKGETASGNFDHDANLDKILFEVKVGPGKTETATFTIPETGEYQIICSIPGHLAAGMTAKLIVK